MLKGTVKVRAKIVDTDHELRISQTCTINLPNKADSIEKVEIEGSDNEVSTTSVVTKDIRSG